MTPGSTSFDTAVRGWILSHQSSALHRFSAITSRVGSVSPMCWLGIFACAYLLVRHRQRGALSCVLAPLLAQVIYQGVRLVFPRTRPPSVAALAEGTPSFPSAHSTTSAAVCCTLAYVLWRERMLTGVEGAALAIIPPALIGMSRVYLDVHWATDVLGGWTAGILIAIVAAVVYREPTATAQ